MPWNVLLLPLLGGFVFLDRFYYTRFWFHRVPSQRMILYAAIMGAVLLVLSTGTATLTDLLRPEWYRWLATHLHLIAPVAHIGKSLFALILGVAAAHICNFGSSTVSVR